MLSRSSGRWAPAIRLPALAKNGQRFAILAVLGCYAVFASAAAFAFTSALAPLAPEWTLALFAALTALIVAAVEIARFRKWGRQTRRAEEGEARFRLLAEEAVDLITRHAPDGTIMFASSAALALLGRSANDLIGLSPLALVHPADNARLRAALERASLHGESASVDLRFMRANGTPVFTELRCRPIAPETGQGWRGFGIIAVTRDMTERRRHEMEITAARDLAESANRAKSRFLANMSHELRTPLNAIIGFSDVMRAEMFGPLGHAKYREYAGLINDSGQHLLELITDVLDMSKIEAGKYDLTLSDVDLPAAMREMIDTVKMAAERNGIRLSDDVPDPCPTLRADKRAVRQIILNLLSNAVKFTPRGGSVLLRVRHQGEAVTLSVHDDGIGISVQDLERLGRPFEQASGAYARKEAGTGLGLALVKSLAEMHGGSMRIESTLGSGTSVHVLFPNLAPENAQRSASTFARGGHAAKADAKANVIAMDRFARRA